MPVNAPMQYTKYVSHMLNFSDVEKVRTMVQTICSPSIRLGTTLQGDPENPANVFMRTYFGPFCTWEFVDVNAFYLYVEEFFRCVPDGLFTINSSSSVVEDHKHCIVGEFDYQGTVFHMLREKFILDYISPSPTSLEQSILGKRKNEEEDSGKDNDTTEQQVPAEESTSTTTTSSSLFSSLLSSDYLKEKLVGFAASAISSLCLPFQVYARGRLLLRFDARGKVESMTLVYTFLDPATQRQNSFDFYDKNNY